MKSLVISVICFVFTFCYGVSFGQVGAVNYLNGDGNSISLRATGFGNNEYKALANAEKNAIEAILFRGIPNSQFRDPFVSVNEIEAHKTFPKYFDSLLGDGRYKTFLLSSIPTCAAQKYKGGKKTITTDVKINIRALRADLEQQGIIRKFGF